MIISFFLPFQEIVKKYKNKIIFKKKNIIINFCNQEDIIIKNEECFCLIDNFSYYKSNNNNLSKNNKTPHNLLEVYSNSSTLPKAHLNNKTEINNHNWYYCYNCGYKMINPYGGKTETSDTTSGRYSF